MNRYEIMEEIVRQQAECIRRAAKVQALFEQDRDEVVLCLKGDIRQSYLELMELEIERLDQIRKTLGDKTVQKN